jgi:hypothetical protein
MAGARFPRGSALQAQRLAISQSFGQAPAVLGSHIQWGMEFQPQMPQSPKYEHGDQQADPYPEQLGKKPILGHLQ